MPLLPLVVGRCLLVADDAAPSETRRDASAVSLLAADEANVLMEWREEDKGETQLRQLLRFFVNITKESNRAHVVLATRK